jgi:hypothetical protein
VCCLLLLDRVQANTAPVTANYAAGAGTMQPPPPQGFQSLLLQDQLPIAGVNMQQAVMPQLVPAHQQNPGLAQLQQHMIPQLVQQHNNQVLQQLMLQQALLQLQAQQQLSQQTTLQQQQQQMLFQQQQGMLLPQQAQQKQAPHPTPQPEMLILQQAQQWQQQPLPLYPAIVDADMSNMDIGDIGMDLDFGIDCDGVEVEGLDLYCEVTNDDFADLHLLLQP